MEDVKVRKVILLFVVLSCLLFAGYRLLMSAKHLADKQRNAIEAQIERATSGVSK